MCADPYELLRDSYTRCESQIRELQAALVWTTDAREYDELESQLRDAERSLECIKSAGCVVGVWLPNQNSWFKSRFASKFDD